VNGTEVVPGVRTVFKVDIDISLKVKDCPADGLAAVDFRVAHGLPPAPTREVRVKYAADSDEPICRALFWMLNDDADLVVKTGTKGGCYEFTYWCSGNLNSRPGEFGHGSTAGFMVPADLLRPFTDGSAGAADVAALMAELGVQTAHFKGEAAAKEKAKELEEAERKRLAAERDAASKAERQADADREAKEVAAWAEANGSDRLRACVANGWECKAVYHDERLAAEYPGWQFDGSNLPGWKEPRNPPVEAVELFETAKAMVPDSDRDTVGLVYWTADDEDGETTTGYAVLCCPPWADGNDIIYGYTGPV
jgi:hypothetical protein